MTARYIRPCTSSKTKGWIKAEWKTTDNTRRGKFYSLTRLGRRQLEKQAENSNRLATAIPHLVKLEEG